MNLILKKNFLFYGSILALPLAGCAKRPVPAVSVATAESDPDRVSVDFNISRYLKPDAVLGEQEKIVIQELSEGKKISHRGLTELFVARHQKTRSEITGVETQDTASLDAVVSQMKEKALETPDQFKKILEEVLAKNSGKSVEDFFYNRDAVNIFDYLNAGLFQCYSATSLYMVSRRSVLSGEDFLKDSAFVIFESGHIKSGYRNKDGQVIALEHTNIGPARETFANEKEFEDLRDKCEIRVVDSNKWILNEIFKDSLDLSNAEKQLAYLKDVFGEKYAHCFEGQALMGAGQGAGTSGLNASYLGFGVSLAPAGNVKPEFSVEKPFKTDPARFTSGVVANLIPGDLGDPKANVVELEKPKEPRVIEKLGSEALQAEVQKLLGIAAVKSGDLKEPKSLDFEEISDGEFLERVRQLSDSISGADEKTLHLVAGAREFENKLGEKILVVSFVYPVFFKLSYIDWFAKKILKKKKIESYKSLAVAFFEKVPVEVSEYLFDNGRGMHTAGTEYIGALVFLKNEICSKPEIDPKFLNLCQEFNKHWKLAFTDKWGVKRLHEWEFLHEITEGRPDLVENHDVLGQLNKGF